MNNGNKRSFRELVSTLPEYACLVVLVVIVLTASILAPNFFTADNILNILKQASVVTIVAIGMGIVLISGCMDLSVGVNMAICAILAMTLQKHVGVAGAMIITLLVGLGISLINFLIVYITSARAVEIMMITFGLKMAYRGFAQALTQNVTFREETSEFFSNIGKGQTGIFPNIVLVMLFVAVVIGIVLAKSKFGREVVCIGNNPEASRLSGISVPKTRLKCFLIAGACCAVAGMLLASRTGAVNALSGDGYEMDAMCGLVIGGFAVFGGYGSAWRAIVGVFVYCSIKNVLNLLGVDSYGQQLVQGIIILVAVWVDVYLKNKRLGGKVK